MTDPNKYYVLGLFMGIPLSLKFPDEMGFQECVTIVTHASKWLESHPDLKYQAVPGPERLL